MEIPKGEYVLKSGILQYSLVGSTETLSDTIVTGSRTSKSLNKFLSTSGYTYKELKTYSLITYFIIIFGFIFHSIVLIILIYQQIKRVLLKNKNKKLILNKKFLTFLLRDTEKPANQIEVYNNYVTYAFVFHQSIVDLIRIVYSIFFANRLYYEHQKDYLIKLNQIDAKIKETSLLNTALYSNLNQIDKDLFIKNLTSNTINYSIDSFYGQYCTQMASVYSVLTMVTIVNILTILISETCRFYDLKFNSNDTSNYCCVLFGILLIWTSSLIIISSLMLVGVADSAAPTWNCDLGESETSTRSLVINIVWFFLVSFVILIAVSYSISLYKELNRFDHEDNRFCLYTINASLLAVKSDFIERQIKISKLTTKRLFILIILICLFCFCFLPNFVFTILKNSLEENNIKYLKPYNLISSIINLANSSLNSIVLVVLCLKSNDTYLINVNTNNKLKKKTSLLSLINKIVFPKRFSTTINSTTITTTTNANNNNNNNSNNNQENFNTINNEQRNTNIIFSPNQNEDEQNSCLLTCNEECIQLKSLSSSKSCKNDLNMINCNSVNTNKNSNYSISRNNLDEFYSKIGNRLGNIN